MEWMPASMWDIWESGDFSGPNRPVLRVTVQKASVKGTNGMRTQLFNQTAQQVEIPQEIVKAITIDRRLGEASAQMTMVIINQLPLSPSLLLDVSHAGAVGQDPELPTRRTLRDLQSPGIYSFRRGMQEDAQARWGHNLSGRWQDMFIPNRVIRTWQGYGTDGASFPWMDTRLIQTGTWLIDRVVYNADGTIQIVCRDMAKLLIEQRLYPPIVPKRLYPLEICKEHTNRWTETIETQGDLYALGPDVGGHKLTGYDSSVALPGVLSWNASVYGHRASHAFDNDATTYWLSEGYYDRNEKSPFLASDTNGEPINFVRCQMKYGGYGTGYVAVKVNGAWVGINGTQLIPGTTSGNLNAANQMSYVALAPINTGDGDWWEIDLGATYNAEEVRVYVRGLADTGLVPPFRAAIAEMEVRLRTETGFPAGPVGPNLVPDGTFEGGVGGWVKARNPVTLAEFDPGSTLSIYTLDFYEGTQSLRVNPDELFAGAQRELPDSVVPGQRVRVTARVVSGGPEDKFRLVIRGLDNTGDGGTLIAASSPAETQADNEWVQLVAEGVIPSGHTGFLIRLSVVSTTDPAGVGPFNIDAVTAYVVDAATEITIIDHIEFIEGINDYTEIVKVFAAWAGFYWPEGAPDDPILTTFSGNGNVVPGRVWGDFFYSGAYPVDPLCIPADFWDNKSVMDGINQIKDILGFICYVDASGGLVWRMPNIWRTGNFVVGFGYESVLPEIDEEKVLLDYGASVDDTGLRSQIIVVSSDDPTLFTAIEPGYVVADPTDPLAPETMVSDKALLGGQQRVALVPNFPFVSQEEVDKFAYLVSLWMHWSYRKGRVRVPGNPVFQPDDQVRIWERTTAESFVHYIHGVSSVMDLQKGTWHLDLDTQWLGDGPSETWLVNSYLDMPPALFAYLQSIGEIPTDVDPSKIPDMGGYVPPDDVSTDVWDRVNDDFTDLFPGLPPVIYDGIDDTWSDEEIAQAYGTGTTPNGVQSRSEDFFRTQYGPPSSGLVTIKFVEAWQSIYANPPIGYPVPANTWEGQTSTRYITVPAVVADAYRLLGRVFCEFEYFIGSDTGAYNYRTIAGTNVLSAHAWGLAIDVNWGDNPFCTLSQSCYTGAGISSLFRQAAESAVARIKTKNSRQRVFGWGGYWRSKKDWMHFEVVCERGNAEEGFILE